MKQSKNGHSVNAANLVLWDVRNLFPEMEKPPVHQDLIDKIQIDHYLEKTEEIYRLNLISTKGAIDDISHVLKLDDSNLKGIAWACLGYMHTFNGNYRRAFTSFSIALDQTVTDSVKAYVFSELSSLWRKLGYLRESLSILETALSLTKNEKLMWRITTSLGLCQKYSHPHNALALLQESAKYYERTRDPVRLGVVLRHIASTYIHIEEFTKASAYIDQAMAVAVEHDLVNHQFAAMNEKGWMFINEGRMSEARDLFNKLTQEDLPLYDMSLALQNLGYLEYESRNYREAIRHHSQSLQLTTKYEMRDMAFEDFYKLGLCHEKLGEIGLAHHFYSTGYQELIKEVDMHLPILGYRKNLLEAYVQFLDNNQKIPHVDIQDNVFGFTMNKTMEEIRNLFQKSLLGIHLERSKNAPQMCRHLGIHTRTYFLYQKKLGLRRGEPRKGMLEDNPHFSQYIESLAPLNWKEANRTFEDDLFSYLMAKYQHNKTKVADVLRVSYAQVVIKTKRAPSERGK